MSLGVLAAWSRVERLHHGEASSKTSPTSLLLPASSGFLPPEPSAKRYSHRRLEEKEVNGSFFLFPNDKSWQFYKTDPHFLFL